jgi:MFS family permease
LAARPFVCLTLAALVSRQERIRRLCFAAMLVGASGLIIAGIAGTVGPVAILLQGQAWRWMWITGFLSVVLIAPTALLVWRDPRCGPLCALLLVLGWTYADVDGLGCADGALMLWLMRSHISTRAAGYLRWAAAVLGLILVVALIADGWTIAGSVIPESGREPPVIGRLRAGFGMGMLAVLLVGLCWVWLRKHRTRRAFALAAAAFMASSAVTLPGAVKQLNAVGTRAEIEQFKDWREHIPATSTVLLVPMTNSAAFAWFTLGRPSYLSVDQSAGVVFSRATALEIRRRSEMLRPIGEPAYKILDRIERQRADPHKKVPEPPPLTAAALTSICEDPQPKLGFDGWTHRQAGNFKDWNLYDCLRVRAGTPEA